MADWTAVELRDRVLENVGAKAAGQAASAEDASLVDAAVIAAHDRLRTLSIAPFDLSAIPPWAQTLLRDYVAGDVGREFGLGDSLKPAQAQAERDLHRQCAIRKPSVRIRAEYF